MIGDLIRQLRKNKNITQQELAKHAGVTTSSIGMYETGVRMPSYEVITKIADFFNVSTDFLLGRVKSPNEYSLEEDYIPDVMKPFKKFNTLITIEFDDDDKNVTMKERKQLLEDELRKINAQDYEEFKKLIALLPESKKNEPISIYDLFSAIGNDPHAMLRLKLDELDPYKDAMKNTISFPLLKTIEPGQPAFRDDNYEGWIPTNKQFISKESKYFYLKIQDDSMDKEFKKGSLALIEVESNILTGDIALVIVNGVNAIVRKIVFRDNLITLMPLSNNSEHLPEIYDMSQDEIQIIGKVVLAVKKY